jgi:hypothetical protein
MLRGIWVSILLLATIGGTDAHTRYSTDVHSSPNSWADWVRAPAKQATVEHHGERSSHRVHRGRTRSGHTTVPVLPSGSGDLVTVPTAAGIAITVQRKLVPNFQGFVDDLVKIGYTPKHIGCWAPVGTHVRNSNHYHGGACDFDQTGWGRTAPQMYHIASLASKWGLRDGCSFRRSDCGHVDDGTNIGWKHPNNLIARYVDYQTTPVPVVRRYPAIIDNFEE